MSSAAVTSKAFELLEVLYTFLNIEKNKNEDDFEIYDIDLIEKSKNNEIYMSITTILKEYPKIMIAANISKILYKEFSDELKKYVLNPKNKNKSFCDLILFDLICSMRLDLLSTKFSFTTVIEKVDIYENLNDPDFLPENDTIYSSKTIIEFLKQKNVNTALNIINNFITDFSIPIEKKFKLYKILKFLLDKIYNTTQQESKKLLEIFNRLIKSDEIGCAPRTIIEGYSTGGYNNKSGDIDYHICKANFKQTFKKVSAKSSREAAKMVAMKVIKDKKKSAKFSLKRMIGKKEKCYDYDVSIDKSGKIIIKNQ